jgi:hypothetical protein
MKFLWNYIKSRLPLLLVAFCIITCAVASMVYAKYVANQGGDATINITANGTLDIVVESESADGSLFEYSITNVSTNQPIVAYIRAAVVVNWQDSEGNLWAIPPKASDYTITASNCTLLDGYYYYNGTRAQDQGFPITVRLAAGATPPSGYTLHVQILAESIQSVPADAAEKAWDAKFNGTKWETVSDQGN